MTTRGETAIRQYSEVIELTIRFMNITGGMKTRAQIPILMLDKMAELLEYGTELLAQIIVEFPTYSDDERARLNVLITSDGEVQNLLTPELERLKSLI